MSPPPVLVTPPVPKMEKISSTLLPENISLTSILLCQLLVTALPSLLLMHMQRLRSGEMPNKAFSDPFVCALSVGLAFDLDVMEES